MVRVNDTFEGTINHENFKIIMIYSDGAVTLIQTSNGNKIGTTKNYIEYMLHSGGFIYQQRQQTRGDGMKYKLYIASSGKILDINESEVEETKKFYKLHFFVYDEYLQKFTDTISNARQDIFLFKARNGKAV